MTGISRETHKRVILNPGHWPLLVLPLKRYVKGSGQECAIFTGGSLIALTIPEDAPIEIYIGTIFEPLRNLPRKQYANVDALLDDGWEVD